MATTVTSTKSLTRKRPASGFGAGNGNGKRGGPGGSGGNGREGDRYGRQLSFDHFRIATWVALAAIAMMFTALTSAYIVRTVSPEGTNDWHAVALPRILWLSTGLILTSSVTFEVGRKALKRDQDKRYGRFLVITIAFGLGFVASQLFAWRELVRQGIYLATNPHSSFFYLLTGAHGIHLLGGIIGLGYLFSRYGRVPRSSEWARRREAVAGAIAIYWHFMDGLWMYLFLLLSFWR